jgi:hypothetical protein
VRAGSVLGLAGCVGSPILHLDHLLEPTGDEIDIYHDALRVCYIPLPSLCTTTWGVETSVICVLFCVQTVLHVVGLLRGWLVCWLGFKGSTLYRYDLEVKDQRHFFAATKPKQSFIRA